MFDLFFKIFPFIVRLMGIAESIYSAPKSGGNKKAFVVDAAKTIVDGIAAGSTGGQAETWERIEQPVDSIIDSTAAILFPAKGFSHPDISR